MDKIAEIDGVSGVGDSGGMGSGKYGIRYIVRLKRMSEGQLEDTQDKIERVLSGSAPFDIGYTHRKRGGTSFGRMSVCDFIGTWVKYRVSLEVAVIKHLFKVEKAKLFRQTFLLWAVDNLDTIMKALKDKKNGPKKNLMKAWPDKDEEFIDGILGLQVRQLSSLERPPIVTKIKECKAEMKALKADLKDPNGRILRDFKTDVAEYVKKQRTLRKKNPDHGDRID